MVKLRKGMKFRLTSDNKTEIYKVLGVERIPEFDNHPAETGYTVKTPCGRPKMMLKREFDYFYEAGAIDKIVGSED